MKKIQKRKYEAPALEVVFVELEQGIAAASVTLGGGAGTTPDQPQVNDWQETGIGSQNQDL